MKGKEKREKMANGILKEKDEGTRKARKKGDIEIKY